MDKHEVIVTVNQALDNVIYLDAQLIGSTFIVGTGADVNILVRVFDFDSSLYQVLNKAGYASSLTEEEEYIMEESIEFLSFKKDNINLLFVKDDATFQLWFAAARLCRALHAAGMVDMLDKNNRIKYHQLIFGERDDL